jgi:hypothetical protein
MTPTPTNTLITRLEAAIQAYLLERDEACGFISDDAEREQSAKDIAALSAAGGGEEGQDSSSANIAARAPAGLMGSKAPSHLDWRFHPDMPKPGRKIVALYDDGSGGQLFFAHEGGLIDADGHDRDDLDNFSAWAYLPPGFKLWCELRGDDDAFTFPDEAPSSQTEALPPVRDEPKSDAQS